MKKLIKTLTIFIIGLIIIGLLMDNIILKYATIYTIKKITNKTIEIDKAAIEYLPTIKIEYTGLKVPNINNEKQYLISADKIRGEINPFALIYDSLVIEDISAINVKLHKSPSLETVMKTDSKKDKSKDQEIKEIKSGYTNSSLENISETKNTQEKNKKDEDILSKYLQKMINGLITTNIEEPTVNTKKIDELKQDIIDRLEDTNKEITLKRSEVLKQVNGLQYEINKTNIKNINSLESVTNLNKKLDTIKNDIASINYNIDEIKNHYSDTLISVNINIKEIENEYNQSIKEINIKSENKNNFNQLNKIVTNLINSKNLKFNHKVTTEKEKDIFLGKTYNFEKENHPKFVIRNLVINKKDDPIYIKGNHLTISKQYSNGDFFLNMIMKEQNQFKELSFEINSKNRKNYFINGNINKIIIQKQTLYENEDIKIIFLKNKTTNTDISGFISEISSLNINVKVEQPEYRVINKSNSLGNIIINAVVNSLNNKTITATIFGSGEWAKPEIQINSNIAELINEATSGHYNDLVANKKKAIKQNINKKKNETISTINNELSIVTKEYTDLIDESDFQIKELNLRYQKKIDSIEKNKKRSIINSIKKNNNSLISF